LRPQTKKKKIKKKTNTKRVRQATCFKFHQQKQDSARKKRGGNKGRHSMGGNGKKGQLVTGGTTNEFPERGTGGGKGNSAITRILVGKRPRGGRNV